ncbi:MAG TPA: tetratricopeptide repeat protein, partial [Steroidobacteraceae bacterium]|nr:tetratricopeptide repeat protein [Steroidobacteraceae bacterium]
AALAAALIAVGGVILSWKSADRPVPTAPAAVTHSIAVLPFLDMSEAKDQHYLADGMTEEILNHLAKAENLRVIARTSTFALRDTKLDVKEIGDRLGVDYVLEGSVRRSGDRVRITAQLIDAATNLHAWSQTYDRTLDDLFAVQDDIAASVASALQVELADGAARDARQPSFQAYEQYLLGQTHYYRRGPGDVEESIDYYRRSVEIDPRFARAWAALAGAYALLDDANPGNEMHREQQGDAARRAVALDPKLAVAQARLAQYFHAIGQHELGNEHFENAVTLDPNDPLVLGFTSSKAVARGDLPAAIDIWRRLVQQDPLSQLNHHNLGTFLLATGRQEEAIAEFRRALELSPTGEGNQIDLARALILTGETTEAASLVLQRPPGLQRDLIFALLVRDPQHGPAARALLSQLKVPPVDVSASVYLAEALTHSGEHEAAFRVLEATRAETERRKAESATLQLYLRDELLVAPFLAPLHDDPRWAKLTASPPAATWQ